MVVVRPRSGGDEGRAWGTVVAVTACWDNLDEKTRAEAAEAAVGEEGCVVTAETDVFWQVFHP
jgi:hypothetical protein